MGGRRGAALVRPGSRSIGVSVAAGATTFTVMPRGASSAAQDRARPTSAALLAAYWLRPAAPEAVRLPTSTTRPPSAIPGTSASARREATSTCSRHIAPPASGSSAPSGAVRMKPAAWTIAVGRSPSSAGARAAGSSRSTARCEKPGPRPPGSVRLSPVTAHPSRSSRSTMAAPIPELAPVTTACRGPPIPSVMLPPPSPAGPAARFVLDTGPALPLDGPAFPNK